MRRALAVGLGLLAAILPAGAAAGAAAGTPLTITADEMATDAAGTVVATGRVRVTDGRTVAEGARLVLDPRRRTAVFTPGTVRGPQGALRGRRVIVSFTTTRVTEVRAEGDAAAEQRTTRIAADVVALRLRDGSVAADGRVRVLAAPDIQAAGTRLLFKERTDLLTMAGPVRVQTARGVAEGARLEARVGRREVMIWGRVRLRVNDIDAQAQRVTLFADAKRAVLVGGVRVAQQGRLLWAERVTVDYGTGRVVAAGPLRMHIPQVPTPAPP
jgi:lipopolysaccharide export system protein LptA